MGLDNAGKSTIAKNVFEGKPFDELENLPPTKFIDTNEYHYRQLMDIGIFDCGGQKQFMDAYKTDNFKDKVFGNVDLLFWVIDISDVKRLKNSLTEFTKCYILLNQNSPEAKIHFLAHKYDSKVMDIRKLKSSLKELVSPQVLKKIEFHSTSVKQNTARTVIRKILDSIIQEKMGDRLISLQDIMHSLNKRISSSASILINSEDGLEIASAFEKYLQSEKIEFFEYFTLKLTSPTFLINILKEFKQQGFLTDDKSNFSVYKVGENSIVIDQIHQTIIIFTISSQDSLSRIAKGIEYYKPAILSILKLD